MWAGRFAKALDSKADDFNSSIRFDCKMYRQDITGSVAHANMLAKQGIISKEDCDAIVDGLVGILEDIESGSLEFDMGCEDIPLGDIVISLEKAARQGYDIGHSIYHEVAFLCVHSTLHLLGYDHETTKEEEKEMFRKQKEIMEIMGY